MPAVRLSSSRRGSAVGRRRSSLVAKAGSYGYISNAPVTFAPNVTPISYTAPSPTPSPFGSPSLTSDLPLPLFPPSATPAPPPTRRRVPPGKRRSQGYVPRPPNAFMLFRADFVRQKHVPGSIETNHGSLSKIIGNCWRSLPLPEKAIWETKAKHAKAEHKIKYPDYKFRPVHTKKGNTAAADAAAAAASQAPKTTPIVKGQLSPQEDERRCEEVAALLLQGKKGEELAWAVRDLDSRRKVELELEQQSQSGSPDPDAPASFHASHKFPSPLTLDPMFYQHSSPPSSSIASSLPSGSPYALPMPLGHGNDPTWRHRRSSSVPLPNDYAYTFPPFMQNEDNTLPPLGFNPAQQYQYSFPPPPPSSNEDSLAGMPLSISGTGRLPSFSWVTGGVGAGTGASSFSYPRPSFGFGAGYGTGTRGSFSFAGAFGGVWPGGANGSPVGRRASSAQAFFSPSAYPSPQQTQQEEEVAEELPDADTSLFEAGFLNSFGASAAAASPGTSAGPGEGVSPFDEQPMLHAPQPVHPISPLGAVDFDGEQAQQQQQQVYEPEAFAGYATAHGSPESGLELGYPHQGFEFPAEGAGLDFGHHDQSPAMTETYADSEMEMPAYDASSYASEFV